MFKKLQNLAKVSEINRLEPMHYNVHLNHIDIDGNCVKKIEKQNKRVKNVSSNFRRIHSKGRRTHLGNLAQFR
jgi:hypothetical protein